MFNQLADCISIYIYMQTGHFNKWYSILFCIKLELVRVGIVYSVVFIIMKQLVGYTHQWGLWMKNEESWKTQASNLLSEVENLQVNQSTRQYLWETMSVTFFRDGQTPAVQNNIKYKSVKGPKAQ